jgi:antitoxin CptB
MPVDLETRRRRAVYRACHRGTKEMDVLLGRYAETRVAGMAEPQLERFEQLLALPDPELQKWLLNPTLIQGLDFEPEIRDLRAFHDLSNEI